METRNQDIEEIVSHDSLDFGRAYRIIQDKIPFEERSDVLDFVTTIDKAQNGRLYPDNYHMLIAKGDSNSEVVGVVTGYYISGLNMGFVNTLAVRKGDEGRGTGTRLREKLIEKFREDTRKNKRKRLDGVLGEVETNNPWLRRLALNPKIFPFDIRYIQPPLRQGQEGRELVLYLQSDKNPEKISKNRIIKILTDIYRDVYDIENPFEDNNFKEMLKSFENRRYISRKTI